MEEQKVSRILQLIVGIMDLILGVPFLGAAIIFGLLWTPLIVMAILHVITLIFIVKAKREKTASIIGILANTIGIIPFVGMVLHIVSGVMNIKAFFENN